jgi:hypothetical protein
LFANVLNSIPPTPLPSALLPPPEPEKQHYSTNQLLSSFSSIQVDDNLDYEVDETDNETPDLDQFAALFHRERYTGPKVYREARVRRGGRPKEKKPDAEVMDMDNEAIVEEARCQKQVSQAEKERVLRSIKRVRRACLREKRAQAKERRKEQEAAGGGDCGERREGGRQRELLRGPSTAPLLFGQRHHGGGGYVRPYSQLFPL